ncbi:MAG TPA: hypothetical protein VHQ24_15265 [Lachnospiraceae bacterium]|nr:hypothetical protein [Lachnospiraceae bacterium]
MITNNNSKSEMPDTIQDEIPDEMPVNSQDLANYIGHLWNANEQIQIILEVDASLDIDRIKRAVRLTIDAEPILGCKLIESEERPYWKRHTNIDDIKWCIYEEVNDKDVAIKRWLSQPFDTYDHQLKVIIIRSKGTDTLCVKLNHACCDGGGAKDYLHLLVDTYNHLWEDISYIPYINTSGKRDSSKLFDELGVSDPKVFLNPELTTLRPTWAFPFKESKVDAFNFSICRLECEQTKSLYTFTKENNVTMNDLILTAFYRTMFKLVNPEEKVPMEICVTVDLRRYLSEKKAEAICNLSGVVNHRIDRIEDESSISTLKRVSLAMHDIKSNNPGLHSATSMEMMAGFDYNQAVAFMKNAWEACVTNGKSTINLSNMGVVADYPLRLGKNLVTDAYLVTPVFKAPSFMLGASTYNDVLTFTVGYCEPEVKKEAVDRFLDILCSELVACIDERAI